MLTGRVLITGGLSADRPHDNLGRFQKQYTTSWSEDKWGEGHESDGRFFVYLPEHPRAYSNGFVLRSYAVWWLRTGEIAGGAMLLHHKDEDKLNDSFDNLELLTHSEHARHHHGKDPIECLCIVCNKVFFLPQWRINQGKGKYCSHYCYTQAPKTDATLSKLANSLKLAYSEGRR